MNKINGLTFLEYIAQDILVLDGASGTTLQKRGLMPGECPEKWAAEHADAVRDMQKEYIASGSKAIYTFTFGGNPVKLKEYGITDVYAINKKLAEVSVTAADGKAFVGGDVSSTGHFIEPVGDLSFEQAVEAFKEQIRGLYDGGVDFIIIETMIDVAEARAALIAAKEVCPLPVAVSLSFNENGRMLTGASPKEAALALIAAGADIIGVNCSTGPDRMVKVVEEMKKVSNKPVLAKPNAGLPKTIDGQTVFEMDAKEFAQYVKPFVLAGANLIGGCCGTNKEFIEELVKEVKGLKPIKPLEEIPDTVSSALKTLELNKPLAIGCGLDAAVNKDFAALLDQKDYESAFDIVMDEMDNGADMLQIHIPEGYEQYAVLPLAEIASSRMKFPIVLKTSYPETAESLLRGYTGRAVINAAEADENALGAIFASAKKYGAAVVIPPRKELLKKAAASGLKNKDIIYLVSLEDASGDIKWCGENGILSAISAKNADGLSFDEFAGKGINFVFADLKDAAQRNAIGTIR